MTTQLAAAGFIEAIGANPDDRTTWLAFADWLAERDSPAADYCKARAAYLALRGTGWRGHSIPEPPAGLDGLPIPGSDHHAHAPLPADLHPHTAWLMWEDPGTSYFMQTQLYLHHCRTAGAARKFIGWLAGVSLDTGTDAALQAFELIEEWAGGGEVDAEVLAAVVEAAAAGEEQEVGHRRSRWRDDTSDELRRIAAAILTPDPIGQLFPDGGGLSYFLPAFAGTREEIWKYAVSMLENPFPPLFGSHAAA